jgi:transcriptional regulator with PAS, ATPase and Fis domain
MLIKGFGDGKSPGIKNCYDLVDRASSNTANVLITGDTGTGKELFSRALHEKSFCPVGSKIENYSDFRLIAATTRNLEKSGQGRSVQERPAFPVERSRFHPYVPEEKIS